MDCQRESTDRQVSTSAYEPFTRTDDHMRIDDVKRVKMLIKPCNPPKKKREYKCRACCDPLIPGVLCDKHNGTTRKRVRKVKTNTTLTSLSSIESIPDRDLPRCDIAMVIPERNNLLEMIEGHNNDNSLQSNAGLVSDFTDSFHWFEKTDSIMGNANSFILSQRKDNTSRCVSPLRSSAKGEDPVTPTCKLPQRVRKEVQTCLTIYLCVDSCRKDIVCGVSRQSLDVEFSISSDRYPRGGTLFSPIDDLNFDMISDYDPTAMELVFV